MAPHGYGLVHPAALTSVPPTAAHPSIADPREDVHRGGAIPLAPALLLTAASAGMYALAFPPIAARVLAWIALVPLLVAIRGASPARRLALGALWTLLSGWGVGTWMPGAVAGYFDQPLAVGLGLFLLVTALMAAPYYMAFTAAYEPLARGAGAAAPLLVGAAWAAAELARGRLLNGTLLYVGNSPWATFGYSQAGILPVIQIAAVTGVYGISFVLACVNAAVAEVVWKRVRRRPVGPREWRGLGVAAGTLGLVLGFGAHALRSETGAPAPAGAVPIAIAQANLSGAARWDTGGPARTLDVYLRLTLDAFARGRPAIVFWPEAALTFFLESEDLYRRLIGATLHRYDAELVLGAPRAAGPEGSAPYANSVYLMSSDGTLRARYDKQYLLPFMEYLPLRLDMARRRFGRIREFSPGGTAPPLPTRAGPAGVLICNEALLPQVATRRVAEGSAYLLNPSNDSWVPDAGFARQQFDIAALRAVEQRAYLVRASDSGPSGVVDPLGRVVAATAPLTRDVLLATIAPTTGRSLYGRVGDAFGGLCVLATALALLRGDRL